MKNASDRNLSTDANATSGAQGALPFNRESAKRTGWTGWKCPQGTRNPLLVSLISQANAHGLQMQELALQLGVTYGYIAQLRVGLRSTANISRKFSESCARFLKLPNIAVLLLAGQLRLEDFLAPSEQEIGHLEAGLRKMQNDEWLGPVLPQSLFSAGADVQRFVLMLYQEATGRELFEINRVPEFIEAAEKAARLLALQAARQN